MLDVGVCSFQDPLPLDMTIVNGKLDKMKFLCRVAALFLLLATPKLTFAATDLKFDVVTFCCGCSSSICQSHFDHLNFPTANGHYIAMGSDAHRLELATNGNGLAIYYNTLNDGYSTNSGAQQATNIDQYAAAGFTSNGPKPTWIILNEISTGLWQSDANYRVWVHDVAHTLTAVFGYTVIVYSPFPNPGANDSDWQAVASDAYIGIENYLSGSEVLGQGFSVSYCQSQYQSSINSYTARGVARAKLMLGELFAQTLSGTSYGRSGISSNDWDSAIVARDQGALNVGFTGFLTYAWGGNDMGVSTNEQLHFEDTYRTSALPVNLGIAVPFVLIQPQSQTLPDGSDVAFTVFKAGTTATTYQWRLNGTNIPGATGSSLNLTNIQVTAAGNYSVALTNAAGWVISSNAFLSARVPDPWAFEPFAQAITTYSLGANLSGQTNAAGQYWSTAGSGGPALTIQGGNLPVPGLAGATGNSVQFGGFTSTGTSGRFNLGTNATAGTWYYSMAFRLTDISTLNSGGVFWAGFNNSAGSQTGVPTAIVTRLVTRSAVGGFNVGLDKSSGTTGSFVFAPGVFTTNDTIFVVGSYAFNTGSSNDDVSQLWVNPDASTFGLANPPGGFLTSTAGNDIGSAQIASLVLFNRNANEPAGIIADEIRVGTSWASVTPPAESPVVPTLNLSRFGTDSVLTWSTNSPGFVPESSTTLSSWGAVVAPIYLNGNQYAVTNTTSATTIFYRLRTVQ